MAGMDNEDQAAQFMRQLGSMRDGLESIRQVISKAIALRDDGAEERMDARIDTLRQSLTASGTELAERLQATGQQLEKLAEQQALAAPPDQKVYVQHKVPRVLADLVKGQFHLMQEWLRPLLEEAIDNGRDLDQLRVQLESLLANYQQIESTFNAASGKSGSPE